MGIFVITKTIWKKRLNFSCFGQAGPENEQQAYFRKFTKITWYFAVVVAAARACFVVCGRCPCRCQWLDCVVCTASVLHVTRVPGVMAAALFLLLVFVDPDACVVGDQGLDFAQSAWGFLSRNSLLFVLVYRCCSDWCPCNDNRPCEMSLVVILTMLSQCSCRVCWQGCPVA